MNMAHKCHHYNLDVYNVKEAYPGRSSMYESFQLTGSAPANLNMKVPEPPSSTRLTELYKPGISTILSYS